MEKWKISPYLPSWQSYKPTSIAWRYHCLRYPRWWARWRQGSKGSTQGWALVWCFWPLCSYSWCVTQCTSICDAKRSGKLMSGWDWRGLRVVWNDIFTQGKNDVEKYCWCAEKKKVSLSWRISLKWSVYFKRGVKGACSGDKETEFPDELPWPRPRPGGCRRDPVRWRKHKKRIWFCLTKMIVECENTENLYTTSFVISPRDGLSFILSS